MGTLAGILIWAGLSAVVGAVAADFLYAVNVRKPLIPGSASLLLVTCRVGFPARWASRVDPVVALRAK